MLKVFVKFLRDYGVFKEYCDCVREFSFEYCDNGLHDRCWDDVLDSMFSRKGSEDFLDVKVDWHAVDSEWREIYYQEPDYDDHIGYETVQEFLTALLSINKKAMLLSRLRYVR